MTLPQRVVWSEGMLVSPQHLQQADLYHENLLNCRLEATVPHAWGVRALDMDQGALASEKVGIARFQGILPDGTYLSFQADDAEAPAGRPVSDHFPPTMPTLEVFLGLPRERRGAPSIAPEYSDESSRARSWTRYRAVTRTVSDLNGDSADREVAFAQRRITIELTDAAKELIVSEGYDPAFGARPLKRVIQHRIADPLALEILQGKIQDGDHVLVDAIGDRLTFTAVEVLVE